MHGGGYIILVGKTITIHNTSTISANGINGGSVGGGSAGGGGGGGGGIIYIGYNDTITNNGTVTVTEGSGGSGGPAGGNNGEDGEVGNLTIENIN